MGKRASRLDDPFYSRQMRRRSAAVRSPAVFSWAASSMRCATSTLLIGPQFLGFGAELLTVQLADDNLAPVPRLFGLSQSRLHLGQERLQSLVFFSRTRGSSWRL
jgi:hypothetical protein